MTEYVLIKTQVHISARDRMIMMVDDTLVWKRFIRCMSPPLPFALSLSLNHYHTFHFQWQTVKEWVAKAQFRNAALFSTNSATVTYKNIHILIDSINTFPLQICFFAIGRFQWTVWKHDQKFELQLIFRDCFSLILSSFANWRVFFWAASISFPLLNPNIVEITCNFNAMWIDLMIH